VDDGLHDWKRVPARLSGGQGSVPAAARRGRNLHPRSGVGTVVEPLSVNRWPGGPPVT
jgi:hypothetical protein